MKQLLFAGLALSLWSGAVLPGQSAIRWADLMDAGAQNFEDPFAELSYQQLDHLRAIIRARERLAGGGLPDADRARSEARLAEAETAMAQAGIDVEALLAQRWVVAERRKAAATAGNPAVDGQVVTLAGFAVPAPPDPDGTAIVYLVPEPGACSHMPPPNPNQMVRARISGGWTPAHNHEPVRLTGRLTISPSEYVIQVVDGPVEMKTSFAMDVTRVRTLGDFRKAARGEAIASQRNGISADSTSR